MVEWLTWSGMFNEPCFHCRVLRIDHDDDAMGHLWVPKTYRTDSTGMYLARWKTRDREDRGDYDAPLPPPTERRRIREAAGWTQEQVAKELHASRHTISRYERQAGLVNGRRMSGREPSG
ncbi:MAG: helix-turn-helix domain-containing protein, partial [Acidimicrobiia bacterium]|nr:helix-turn-helix domain-containing protein [Acidimicrobiia bacterium]